MTNTDITNLAPQFVRFGGNEASDYSWKLFTYNLGGEYFYEDFGLDGYDSVADTQFTVNSGTVPKSADMSWDEVTMASGANGYRLPTSSEWTWAAMGGLKDGLSSDIVSNLTYGSVNESGYLKGYAGSTEAGGGQANIADYCWETNNSGGTTQPVGQIFGIVRSVGARVEFRALASTLTATCNFPAWTPPPPANMSTNNGSGPGGLQGFQDPPDTCIRRRGAGAFN